jgi:hypothetical protein
VDDHQAGVEQGGEIRDELIRAGELIALANRPSVIVTIKNFHTHFSVELRSWSLRRSMTTASDGTVSPWLGRNLAPNPLANTALAAHQAALCGERVSFSTGFSTAT